MAWLAMFNSATGASYQRAPPSPCLPQRAKGVVLLSILLIVALLSAITVRMVSQHSLHVAQASHSMGSDLTLGYALGAETFAKQLLYVDWSETGPGVDDTTEIWAQPLAPFPLEEYNNAFMEIQLRDLHGCFNLNSLAGSDGKENHARLRRLTGNLGLPDAVADSWRDWVDENTNVEGFGAEDGDYLLREPAYVSANRPAAHVSELALVANVEPEHLAALAPYICTLPDTELKFNVNTAAADVLSSLGSKTVPIGNAADEPPVEETPPTYKSKSEFLADNPDLAPAEAVLSVTSEYFELQTRVQIDGNVTELASVIYRDPASGALSIVARDFGKTFRSRITTEVEEVEGG